MRRGSHLCAEHNRPLGRLGWRDNPVPAVHVNVPVGGLGNGRHLRQCRKSCLGDPDSSNLPCSVRAPPSYREGGASRLLSTHTTVNTGPYPYTAVRWIERRRSFTPAPKARTAESVAPASVPSSGAVRASPFPIAPKSIDLDIQPHGRLEASPSKSPSNVQAFSGSPRLLCRLLTSALQSALR